MMPFPPKYTASCSMFYTMKKKKKKIKFFILIFWYHGNFFDVLLVFVSFLQTYYGICFFHILFFYFYLFQINFCNFCNLSLTLLNSFYRFHNNLSHYLVSCLCFSDNKLCYSFFIHNNNKEIYKTPISSIKLELFIMLIASSLFIYQK